MKKILKFLGKTLLVLFILVVVLLLTTPFWVGPVVKPIANSMVPKKTQTSFNLGRLSFNLYTGRLELGDLQLDNPEGYSEKRALEVDKVVVDVDMTTVFSKELHIEELTVDGLFVSLVKGGENNVDNIDQIQYNIAGGKEKYEAEKAKKEAKAKAEERDDSGDSKKVVIDVLTLKNIKVKYGLLTIPVPSITLKDLGKESNGLSIGELFETTWEAIINAAMAAGDGAKLIGDVLKGGAGKLGDGAGKAMDAIGAGKAADAIGDGAGIAVDAVKDGAGKAVDAIGDGAGKAADAIKGLFK